MIVLKGAPGGVKAKAIDLDHEPLGAPQEVDLEALDAGVDLRHGQPGAPEQAQEQLLGL